MVADSVGKKLPNDKEAIMKLSATPSHHTFQSIRASERPEKPSIGLPSSSFPAAVSSSIRRFASVCSSGDSQTLGVEGKSGKIQIAHTATMMVKVPSTRKSHLQHPSQRYFWENTYLASDLQAVKPSVPSRPAKIPDAIRALKALLTELPQVRSAVRKPSSLRLYLKRFQYTKLGGYVTTIPS